MSADQDINTYSRYKNEKHIGRLAIALAKYTYFGPGEMSLCTITGRKGTKAMDFVKLQQLRNNIHGIFPLISEADFDAVWERCKESIGNACKHLRATKV